MADKETSAAAIWRTFIENVAQSGDGSVNVNVVFVDEVNGRKEARSVRVSSGALESVKAALRDARSHLDVFDSVKEIPLGEIDLEPAPPPVDPAAQALATYLVAYGRFRAIRTQQADGLADQKAVDTAFAELQAAFAPEYLGKL